MFGVSEVEYLGWWISKDRVCMDDGKLCTIKEWPISKNLKGVWSFLRATNFYWRFIQNYAAVAKPLMDLTKKDVPF